MFSGYCGHCFTSTALFQSYFLLVFHQYLLNEKVHPKVNQTDFVRTVCLEKIMRDGSNGVAASSAATSIHN